MLSYVLPYIPGAITHAARPHKYDAAGIVPALSVSLLRRIRQSAARPLISAALDNGNRF